MSLDSVGFALGLEVDIRSCLGLVEDMLFLTKIFRILLQDTSTIF